MRPGVAIVYSDADGRVQIPQGGGRPWARHSTTSSWIRHEVDVSDQRRTARLGGMDLPTARNAHFLEAVIDIGFRVTDPAEIVRRYVTYGASVILNYVSSELRAVTRSFDLEEIHLAEDKFNAEFSRDIPLPEGITIYRLNVRLTPNRTAFEYLEDLRGASRSRDLAAEQHERAKVEAIRLNEIKRIEHAAELERRKAALIAMRDLEMDPYELLLAHAAEHPNGSEKLFEMLNEAWRAGMEQEEVRDSRFADLVKYLIENGIMQAVDIEKFRDDLTNRVREAAVRKGSSGLGWSESSVLPEMKLKKAPSAPPQRSSGGDQSFNGAKR
ncbi:hypothetical protein KBX34_21905 [Micromonospora sp. M61]|nr:hypothetical protein [Micromonospora sp. M61]